jgi:hypothetical protein
MGKTPDFLDSSQIVKQKGIRFPVVSESMSVNSKITDDAMIHINDKLIGGLYAMCEDYIRGKLKLSEDDARDRLVRSMVPVWNWPKEHIAFLRVRWNKNFDPDMGVVFEAGIRMKDRKPGDGKLVFDIFVRPVVPKFPVDDSEIE